jgi:hypothetical protein
MTTVAVWKCSECGREEKYNGGSFSCCGFVMYNPDRYENVYNTLDDILRVLGQLEESCGMTDGEKVDLIHSSVLDLVGNRK